MNVTTVTFMSSWLLLHYKLPNKPSALRVYIWRKLKRFGAVLLHEAVWVLPDLPRTAEQIQWLAAEIEEMGGNAFYWRANGLLSTQEDSIVHQFQEQVDKVYSALLKRLEKSKPDLQEISQEYQRALSLDFFHSKLGLLVREKLTSKRGERS